MKISRNFIFLIYTFLLLSIVIANDTELLKSMLLSREAQVDSLITSYTLTQTGSEDLNATWENEQSHRWMHKGDIYKTERDFIHSTDGPIKKVYSNYNGIITSFQTGDYAPDNIGATGIVGWEKHPEPKGAYLDPRLVLFGYNDNMTLAKRFEGGRLYSWASSDGQEVLSWVADDEFTRYDFYLNKELQLVKIRYGSVPIPKYRETFSDVYNDYPEQDLFNVSWVVEMSDFTEIDGVSVPLKAKKKWLAPISAGNDPESREEAFKRQFMGPKKCNVEQTMLIDPASVKINPELSDEDLRIIFPKGTFVVDKIIDLEFDVGENMEKYISDVVDSVNSELTATGDGSSTNPNQIKSEEDAALTKATVPSKQSAQETDTLPPGTLTKKKMLNRNFVFFVGVSCIVFFFVLLKRKV